MEKTIQELKKLYTSSEFIEQYTYDKNDLGAVCTEDGTSMLVNIAKAGFFSSDRTIAEYNRDIWHL